MTNAMDNKEKAKLFFECAKYCVQIKNYEKAEEFIYHAQKLYPTKKAEEMLCAIREEKAERLMMDNKDKENLWSVCGKYHVQSNNYELDSQFIFNVHKLYPRKEAEELLAEVLSEKKQPELADQEQRTLERKSEFNLQWSKKERWQNVDSHYDTSTKFEVNMTENAAVIIGVGLSVLGTGLLVKSIFDIFDQHKKNELEENK